MVFISPEIDLLLIALVLVTIFNTVSTIVRNRTMGKGHMEEIKKKQKEFKELMKKTDEHSRKRLKELEQELLETNLKMMKASMPTMLLSIAIVIVLWPWLQAEYSQYTFPIVGSWLFYYIVVSLVFSIIISKVQKIILKA